MKRILVIGFVLMGFTFTVTQGLMIRELLVSFYGNELSIGLILGSWLLLEAIGSGWLGSLVRRWGDKPGAFAALQVLFALLLPLCLVAVSASRQFAGAIQGEGVGILPIFLVSALILAPLALVDGAMYTTGSRIFSGLTSSEALSAGRVYVFEALGAILGGFTFTYLFITRLFSLQIVLTLAVLNLLAAGMILVASARCGKRQVVTLVSMAGICLALAAGLLLVFNGWGEVLQAQIDRLQWRGFDLVFSRNSVYGNVSVIHREGQYTFFADGIPMLTSPVPDIVLSEELVHLPMLFVPHAERVLVLSGGLGGVLSELDKYSLKEIEYAELDPLLIEAVREFPTPLTQAELSDPQTRIEHIDGRLLVRQLSGEAGEKFDLVIVNLPYPSTLQLNRFYTVEFFRLVSGLLSPQGVLVVEMPGTLVYMSEELRGLNRMTYHTLGEVFPQVRPVPDELTLWLASPGNELETAALEQLVDTWTQRGLVAQLITSAHLRLKLDQQQLEWFLHELNLEEAGKEKFINRDLHPLGLFYGLSYWHAKFSPEMGRLFTLAGRLNLWVLILFIGSAVAVYLLVNKRSRRGRRSVIPVAIACTGFSGIAADLVMIFAFQSLYGHIYHWIGMFITAFMVGIGLGGWLMTNRLDRAGRKRRDFIWLEVGLVAYWLLVAVVLTLLFWSPAGPPAFSLTLSILLLLNALGGFLVGSQFPLANYMVLNGGTQGTGKIGLVYASDLFGAFLGSVVVAVLLIPVLGILQTCFLVAVLKLGSALLVRADSGL